MLMSVLRPAALLSLLLLPGILTEYNEPVPIEVEVRNTLLGTTPETFSTTVVQDGILLGAMSRLMDSNTDFKFTYKNDPNYGPYLESVNGVAGSDKDHTYWELLVETAEGKVIRPNVGIGCFIPSKKDKIILNFAKW